MIPRPIAAGHTIGTPDTDPGDLYAHIDADLRTLVRVEHVALSGGPHITPEQLDRLAADLIAPALWAGVQA